MTYLYEGDTYESIEDLDIMIFDDMTDKRVVEYFQKWIKEKSPTTVLEQLKDDFRTELYENLYMDIYTNKVTEIK